MVFIKNVVLNVGREIRSIVSRFPIVVVVTIIGTVAACMNFNQYNTFDSATLKMLEKIILLAALAFPLVTLATLVLERYAHKERISVQIVVAVLVGLVYLTLDTSLSANDSARLAALIIVSFVACIFVPFNRSDASSHWRTSGLVVSRLVIAVLFALGLGVGLTLCLFAIEYLFLGGPTGAIIGEYIGRMWAINYGIFASWFWLAGLPGGTEENDYTLPKVVRLFVQYIWIPLVSIFSIILYTYLIKILIIQEWPKGGVAQWILGFSSIGMLGFAVAYNFLREEANGWMRKFFTGFFVSLLPLTIVLFVAIGIRINAYGVTEQRYLVTLGGVWLACNAIYYLLSRTKAIRFAPYTVTAFLVLAVVGPWNMFVVSLHSQLSGLQTLLEEKHIMKEGKIVRSLTAITVSSEEYGTLASKFEYIFQHNEKEKIYPWLTELNIITSESWPSSYAILQQANVQADLTTTGVGYTFYFRNSQNDQRTFVTTGYDFLLINNYLYGDDRFGNRETYTVSHGTFSFGLRDKNVTLLKDGKAVFVVDMSKYLKPLIEKYGSGEVIITNEEATFVVENEAYRLKFVINYIQATGKKESPVITSLSFGLLGVIKNK